MKPIHCTLALLTLALVGCSSGPSDEVVASETKRYMASIGKPVDTATNTGCQDPKKGEISKEGVFKVCLVKMTRGSEAFRPDAIYFEKVGESWLARGG